MSALGAVELIARERKGDARGWLLKVLTGHEPQLPPDVGEIYLVMAEPGQVRGNHYHRATSEWFTVVGGRAQLVLADPVTGERREMLLEAAAPVTVYVPAGVAHGFRNPDDAGETMLLVAYADRRYEPDDTIRASLF